MNRKMIASIPGIDRKLIPEVCTRLAEGKRIRRTLPEKGRLHIDRQLPFLCVYRRPADMPDPGTDILIKGEASYLVTTSSVRAKRDNTALITGIVEVLSRGPGAFLIIEVWSRTEPVSVIDEMNGRTAPSFRILVPPDRIPVETIQSLKNGLAQIVVSKKKAEVATSYAKRTWPEHYPPLLPARDINRFNCYQIGLEVSPIFRDPVTREIFPFVLRKLHRGISSAIKKSAYQFSHKQTSLRPESYKSLGRRAVVKAVWEVDEKLAAISNELEFLLLVTPVNIEQSWHNFIKKHHEKEPVFYYRPIPVDPSLIKRQLYSIPFDRIEDPALSAIFHDKLIELELKLSMLMNRNTRNFFYGSMQLFGDLDEEITDLASRIVDRISPRSHEPGKGLRVNATGFAERARREMDYYRGTAPWMESEVIIRDDITGLMVSNGNLYIGKRVSIPESRVEALINHEVGTHVLTYINGRDQPFQQLYCGLAGCDELQEGLAVLSEYLVGGLSPPRIRLLAGRVLAAGSLIDGATFIDTFRELHDRHGFSHRAAYSITSRIHRSGGFTKDSVYLRGLVNLVRFLRAGGDLTPLLVGKVSIGDIAVINELQHRKVLKPTLLMPGYIDSGQARKRLEDLRNGSQIFNLI
jgi:uncharacterized protein (TIGR02421 family)